MTGAVAFLKSLEPAHCFPNNEAKDQGYLYSSEPFTRMFFDLVFWHSTFIYTDYMVCM